MKLTLVKESGEIIETVEIPDEKWELFEFVLSDFLKRKGY